MILFKTNFGFKPDAAADGSAAGGAAGGGGGGVSELAGVSVDEVRKVEFGFVDERRSLLLPSLDAMTGATTGSWNKKYDQRVVTQKKYISLNNTYLMEN